METIFPHLVSKFYIASFERKPTTHKQMFCQKVSFTVNYYLPDIQYDP